MFSGSHKSFSYAVLKQREADVSERERAVARRERALERRRERRVLEPTAASFRGSLQLLRHGDGPIAI